MRLALDLLSRLSPKAKLPWLYSQESLSLLARIQKGARLENLGDDEAAALVERWSGTPLVSGLLHAIASVYKITHFHRDDIRGSLRRPCPRIETESSPRWTRNVLSARELDEELECDVVVVGTGAGGAVVGRQLAATGHAVVFVEEGELKRRGDYPGSLVGALTELYETAVTIGNAPMLVPRGRLVGGSTAVNGASSFRPPRWVTQRWVLELGSNELSLDNLTPHYEAVERFLQVEPPSLTAVGPFHELFFDGCRSLGWQHGVIARNAPGCQGDGFCDAGCRSGARRSTEVSYIPDALERGALLLTGLSIDKVSRERGRAVGVAGWTRDDDGNHRRVRVRSRAVVVATGALSTPVLLERNRVGSNSRQLGRNLTLHPSGPSLALYEQRLDVARYIPQGHFSSQFLHEGLLLLSAHPDEHVLPTMLSDIGNPLMRKIEQRDRIAGLGFLASDCGKGRVHVGPRRAGLVSYRATRDDVARFHRAQILLAELALSCGAQEVYPGLKRPIVIRSSRDLRSFRTERFGAGDFALTAFHPLGTCRMARSSKRGIVDLNHEAFDLPRLFVVDGSVVSGPLGVNPQLTIMAFARRAAERIAQRLDQEA